MRLREELRRVKVARWASITVLALLLSSSGCVAGAATTSASLPTSGTATPTRTTPSAALTAIATSLARPSAGKPQELTIALKAPVNAYSLVIYLANGETLDLDWKFVANPQVGIRFMFTTPEGREMNDSSQPINLPGHPLYDQSLPSHDPGEVVGSHVSIEVGQSKYCGEGYYSLVYSANHGQSGTIYLRYALEVAAK